MKRRSKVKKVEMADEFFDSLVCNAIDFLEMSVQEIEKRPKYSVIHFATSVELFLKARLLREHWSLVVAKIEKASIQTFRNGEFVSVTMDECLARCVIDFSGRPYLVWRGLNEFSPKKISKSEKGQDASSGFRFGLAREFFQGFTNEARCNLHLELLYGDEPHHIVEALFKAFARAADAACAHDPRIAGQLPSTKGKL